MIRLLSTIGFLACSRIASHLRRRTDPTTGGIRRKTCED